MYIKLKRVQEGNEVTIGSKGQRHKVSFRSISIILNFRMQYLC